MGRIKDRELVFKLIFESCFRKDDNIFEEGTNDIESDKEFIKELYIGVLNKKEDLDNYINEVLTGYKLERIYKVDYAILLLGLYELFFYKTPLKIVANECVELSKKYSTDKSFSFVNGIISKIAVKYNLE